MMKCMQESIHSPWRLSVSVVIVGLFVVGILSANSPSNIASRGSQIAASAPPPTMPSFICRGGSTFVYSRDFANLALDKSNRPAAGQEVPCDPPTGLRYEFAEGVSINNAEICQLTPVSASSCWEAYYAVVPQTGQLQYGTLSYKHAGGLCGVKQSGQIVQFADCAAKETSLHKSAPYFVINGTYSSQPVVAKVNLAPTDQSWTGPVPGF